MLVKRQIPKESINYEMCKKCGGACCLSRPCMYLPSDFKGLSLDAIEEEILSNYAIIDQGRNQGEQELFYYLRIRNKGEDLTREENILNGENVFLANHKSNKRCCLYHKSHQTYYLGIEYDLYDEEKIRSLTKLELENLFSFKNEEDKKRLGYTLPLEESINDYLEKRRTLGWGGCLLSEEKRPGGAIYVIPNYANGITRCTQPKEFYDDNWDQPIHQEKLKTILSKHKII